MRAASAAAAVMLLALGCGSEHRTGSIALPIVGGEPSPSTQDSAVYVLGNGDVTCAGVLVAENLVVTARTCLAGVSHATFVCDATGEPYDDGTGGGYFFDDFLPGSTQIFVGSKQPPLLDPEAQPDAVGLHVVHDDSATLCSHNLAALVLDRKLSAPIAQIRLPGQVAEGELVTAVGFGRTETEAGPVRQMKELPVVAVGPLAAHPMAEGYLSPRTFWTGPALCIGDFGAPAYAASGALVGIGAFWQNVHPSEPPAETSDAGPGALCTPPDLRSVFTQVAGFPEVLHQAFELAGAVPWIEGQPDPRLAKFGEDCGTDAECQSAYCAPTLGTCNVKCSSDADCPASDPACREAGGGSACLEPLAAPGSKTRAEPDGCAIGRGSPVAAALLGLLLALGAGRRRRS